MVQIQTLGLIVNPLAGFGATANFDLARKAVQNLGVRKVITGSGSLGELAISGFPIELVVHKVSSKPSRNQTIELAEYLVDHDLDAIMVVGGDGTMADASFVLSKANKIPPLLGIGAGSTNAGALVTCKVDQIDFLIPNNLTIVPVDALLAFAGSYQIGIGFNDCVLGYTVVATMDGTLRNVSVAGKMAGNNILSTPTSIGLPETSVYKVDRRNNQLFVSGEEVGTVVIGFAEPNFIAKAITGGVCLTSFSGLKAGCLVASLPLVQVELSADEVINLPVIRTSYLSLRENERIVVSGVREGTGLCVDGTPLRLLSPSDVVSFELRSNAINCIKINPMLKGAQ